MSIRFNILLICLCFSIFLANSIFASMEICGYSYKHLGFISINMLTSSLTASLIFHLIIVILPDRKKAKNLLCLAKKTYKDTKQEIVEILLQVLGGLANRGEAEKLANSYSEAKDFFTENNDERWYYIANNITESNIADIIFSLNHLKDILIYLSSNEFVKNNDAIFEIQLKIQVIKNIEHEMRTYYPVNRYDSEKFLLRSIYSLLTGYSFADGYSEEDRFIRFLDKLLN